MINIRGTSVVVTPLFTAALTAPLTPLMGYPKERERGDEGKEREREGKRGKERTKRGEKEREEEMRERERGRAGTRVCQC